MKTNLFGKTNAIVAEYGNNTILTTLGILTCKGGDNIDVSKQLKLMVKEHFSVEDGIDIEIISKEPLTNQKRVKFEAHWMEDNEPRIRELIIFVTPTYK